MFLNRLIPTALFALVTGFAASIGSLAEANTDTSSLVSTDWGLARGSYVLSFEQTSTGGRSAISIVPPPASLPTAATADSTPEAPLPIFITQPNLGFQVILTADYGAYQGPEAAMDNPGQIVLISIASPSADGTLTLSPSDVFDLGVSNLFTGAPFEPGEVSDAGTLYAGDTNIPPTMIASEPIDSVASGPGATPTATGTNPADSSSSSETNQNSPTAQLDGITNGAAVESVPEPSTAIAVSLALIGLGWLKRRKEKAQGDFSR